MYNEKEKPAAFHSIDARKKPRARGMGLLRKVGPVACQEVEEMVQPLYRETMRKGTGPFRQAWSHKEEERHQF